MARSAKRTARRVVDGDVDGLSDKYRRPNAHIKALRNRVPKMRGEQGALPELPPRDAEGNRPARATLWVLLAREIITRRRAAGWTQEDLAGHAGVRKDTVRRLETGKHQPTVRTVDKIDKALRKAGA